MSLDGVIAYGSKAANDYIEAGVSVDRVFIAPNAVSTAEDGFEVLTSDDDRVLKWRIDKGLERPTVITVGRLIPEKRIELLLEACRILGDRCDLLIVGDGPERVSLEQLAQKIFPRARFTGHLEGESLSVAFGASEVFALPGAEGLAIHEAMAHAKPVIVGRADGTESDLLYRRAIADLDLDPTRCIAVGDKTTDLIPAIELGAEGVLIVQESHVEQPAPEEESFQRAENLRSAVERLLG
jgi:glycosyltransferase involved in cell wall biosynthesis